ncbi:hypothetical protein ACLOJK_013354 [Asimina triloba]
MLLCNQVTLKPSLGTPPNAIHSSGCNPGHAMTGKLNGKNPTLAGGSEYPTYIMRNFPTYSLSLLCNLKHYKNCLLKQNRELKSKNMQLKMKIKELKAYLDKALKKNGHKQCFENRAGRRTVFAPGSRFFRLNRD